MALIKLIHHFIMASTISTPICGTEQVRYEMEQDRKGKLQPINPLTEPLPISTPRSAAKQEAPLSNTGIEHKPNYWEPIMIRHAKDLDYLPVPPKDFVRRERKATMSTKSKEQDYYKVSLKHLLRRESPRHIPPRRDNECFRWVLQPITEKPLEPMPGVPTVTVTDANGKTWWPKDPNSYITMKQEADISARAMKQHHGPDSEAHCAAFQEAYRKGLDNKPKGMRPEVLYCFDCWTKQEEIEQEQTYIVDEESRMAKYDATIERLLTVTVEA